MQSPGKTFTYISTHIFVHVCIYTTYTYAYLYTCMCLPGIGGGEKFNNKMDMKDFYGGKANILEHR